MENKDPTKGAFLQVGENGMRIPFDMIVTSYRSGIWSIQINVDRGAELIVSGLGENDIFIHGD